MGEKLAQGPAASRLDDDYRTLFQLAPVSLWLEDFSAVRQAFTQLRADGVTNLRRHLRDNPSEVARCSSLIRVLDVNRRTLDLFRAADLDTLVANLHTVFRDDMFDQHVEELGQLWDGDNRFSSQTVNYTLDGERLDIRLEARVMPGHEDDWSRVLLSIEDITARVRNERDLRRAQQYAVGLFEHSPVSLWVEDFSVVKMLLDEVRAAGITDFRTFLNVHPDSSRAACRKSACSTSTSRRWRCSAHPARKSCCRDSATCFATTCASTLPSNWSTSGMKSSGSSAKSSTTRWTAARWTCSCSGRCFPGEADWDQVLVSLTDITARKKAEAYVEFLGKHDVLTKLYNRAYYEDELARLGRKGPWPVSVIAVDLNGLKAVNDQFGHGDGDGCYAALAKC
jgi:hypothetical protein